mmetsp:Transcript_35592/g.69723  ORF Transcript_35592/g.69723 Transcript_35592/m.69723 type:complete len:199 (+) Transcript_35592:247-843(+)|eukprot:CAMPEP_0173385954 /NCGR_PEP_ID=MMETSP1356-20130122/8555_1 /TAXON_ID=77927 ORGANISM="Hemiselmis virescens, Strain PCC157" /NCGR_SAMPLE_ID=MMETSP1356 /ASSEMBLY_ACC=CAM_ASM_000847 /LENGTH=198 /DNA_ID=CAMNT_0014341983 /DNA_START=223 /DNA_END=819 /DNA_ORIENTATION=-
MARWLKAKDMVCLTVVLLVGAVSSAQGVGLTPDQEEGLPDFGDPQVASRLKCSACRASAVEMHEAMQGLRAKRGKAKIKEYEYTEVMDEVCEGPIKGYGIQLRNNLPTHKFSKDMSISRAQGHWAGRYVTGVCADLYRDYEDDLLELQGKPLLQFVEEICRDRIKVCDAESVRDIALGDERGFEYDKDKNPSGAKLDL